MKIIVVGGGERLEHYLVAENHDVILIEKDESVLNKTVLLLEFLP